MPAESAELESDRPLVLAHAEVLRARARVDEVREAVARGEEGRATLAKAEHDLHLALQGVDWVRGWTARGQDR